MRIIVARTPEELGEEAARLSSEVLLRAIERNGTARIAAATGVSQLSTLAALSGQKLPWEKIELLQLHERMDTQGNPVCREALAERFAKKLPLKKVHYLENSEESLKQMNAMLRQHPADLILIGLGKQGQVGFNAAPADFGTEAPYVCIQKEQEDPLITMTVREMLRSGCVIVCAPYEIQAENVWRLMMTPLTENFPASALKRHPNLTLLLDRESAQYVSPAMTARYTPELTEFEVIGDADWVK